jgi:two-component system response regulator (stage 0 sporulation protein F)
VEKILVVDDEQVIRILFDRLLSRKGYEVILAENGQEGLELLQREHPHAVILDLKMPGMDGIAVLQHIRLVDRKIPVIVLTGARICEIEQQLDASGVTEFLEKEFALYRLVDSLQRHLKISGTPT